MPAKRPGVEVRVAADGTKTYRVRWRPGGGRGSTVQSHSFSRLVQANSFHDELRVGGRVCYCRRHAPDGEPVAPMPTGIRPAGAHGDTRSAGPTFGEYAERHAAALTGVGEGYRRDVVRDVRRHLQGFAGRPIASITELEVREWIRGMEAGTHPWLLREEKDGTKTPRPLSPTTIRRNLAQAGAIMAAAYTDGLVNRNVFRGHRLARRQVDQHDDMTFLTHAEWQLLRSCLPDGVYRDLCTVLVGTGLRWGEVSALAVGAIDVLADPPRLHVTRAWVKDGRAGVVLGVPKSARSRRTVTFTAAVRDALIPHLVGKGDDELVFTTPSGRPLLHSNFYGKVWLPAVAKAQNAGLTKRPRLHDLRHTYVSWLIAAGRPIAEISRRVGHQSYKLTADRYGHIMPESDVAALAALDRAMPTADLPPRTSGGSAEPAAGPDPARSTT